MSIYKQNFLSKGIVFLFLLFPFCIISCPHKISGEAINYSFKSKDHLPDYGDLNVGPHRLSNMIHPIIFHED